jgi:hypothetical protein
MSVIRQPSLFGRLQLPAIGRPGWRKVLLACGAASTLLYIGMDAIAALRYDGYSYTDQTISELSAVDAPTRSLWIPPGFVYGVLMIAFGVGVWAAGPKRALRLVAGFAAAIGVIGLVAWPFAPMHQRAVLAAGGSTASDTMHLVLAGVDSVLFMLSIAVGAATLGRRFRVYSIATFAVVFVSGALTSFRAGAVQADEPTPWLGIEERVTVFGSMLWLAVLAVALLRRRPAEASHNG